MWASGQPKMAAETCDWAERVVLGRLAVAADSVAWREAWGLASTLSLPWPALCPRLLLCAARRHRQLSAAHQDRLGGAVEACLAVPCGCVQRGWRYDGRSKTVLSPLFIFVRTKPTFIHVQFPQLDSSAPLQTLTLESLFIWTKQFAKLPSIWEALPGMLQPVVRFDSPHVDVRD